MGDVVELGCATTLPVPSEKVLSEAIKANLKNCIVVGETQDGDIHFAMSISDAPLINFLLDCAKKALLDESCP